MTRRVHAGAWWAWAVFLAFAATRTTNPILLGLIVAVAMLVVATHRPPAAGTGFRLYLGLALVVVAIRIGFRILLGGDFGDRVLVTLPEFGGSGGIALGGPVTLEETLSGAYEGLRLATIIICVGAANTLADPRRLLASFPKALGGVAAAVAVALSLAPQLIESVNRVRAARRLRGEQAGRVRAFRALLVPVLEDTLSRSMALAASMDGRGFGRDGSIGSVPMPARIVAYAGLGSVLAGMSLLISTRAVGFAALLLVAGLVATVAALVIRGRGIARSRYRPDSWGGNEWAISFSGAAVAAGMVVLATVSPAQLHPALEPLTWPVAGPLGLGAVLVAALPALITPRRPSPVLAAPERLAA
ncbi:MAG TPA: CbiQ family ECF transporter T component [Acidimicrobiia bacterium]|nr:CbiQ family ECF transporter T component [Acidimicrobiia bacterium]